MASSLLKKSMIAGINARASESISYCGIPVLFFLLVIPRCYVICSILFSLYSVIQFYFPPRSLPFDWNDGAEFFARDLFKRASNSSG